MAAFVARVGRFVVRIQCEGRIGRLNRVDWPLGSPSLELKTVLTGLLRREPPGSQISFDVDTVDRAIIERRRRFGTASG